MDSSDGLVLAQVALVTDQMKIDDLTRWYHRVFGFLPAGGVEFEGPELAHLFGLSATDTKIRLSWLVEQNDTFQLELFQFDVPKSRPRPRNWTPRDTGYNLVTVYVDDFDAVIARAGEQGASMSKPLGASGERRATVADPNGILLEILERDIPADGASPRARPDVGVAIRSITASVPDLREAVAFFGGALGLPEADVTLHRPEHEAMWGLAGSERMSQTFLAGDIFLELVQYTNPSGAPRTPDYQLSDAGIMNIALSTPDKDVYVQKRDALISAGYDSPEFVPDERVAVSYVRDKQGFSVELLFMHPTAYADFGFVPVAADEASA